MKDLGHQTGFKYEHHKCHLSWWNQTGEWVTGKTIRKPTVLWSRLLAKIQERPALSRIAHTAKIWPVCLCWTFLTLPQAHCCFGVVCVTYVSPVHSLPLQPSKSPEIPVGPFTDEKWLVLPQTRPKNRLASDGGKHNFGNRSNPLVLLASAQKKQLYLMAAQTDCCGATLDTTVNPPWLRQSCNLTNFLTFLGYSFVTGVFLWSIFNSKNQGGQVCLQSITIPNYTLHRSLAWADNWNVKTWNPATGDTTITGIFKNMMRFSEALTSQENPCICLVLKQEPFELGTSNQKGEAMVWQLLPLPKRPISSRSATLSERNLFSFWPLTPAKRRRMCSCWGIQLLTTGGREGV